MSTTGDPTVECPICHKHYYSLYLRCPHCDFGEQRDSLIREQDDYLYSIRKLVDDNMFIISDEKKYACCKVCGIETFAGALFEHRRGCWVGITQDLIQKALMCNYEKLYPDAVKAMKKYGGR